MIDDAVGRDIPVVAADNAADGGETDAGPLEVLVAVQAVEGVEELAGVEHVEARAVVAHEPSFLFRVPAEVDDADGLLRAELDGVAEEVFEGDLGEFGVGPGEEAGLDVERDVAAGVLIAQTGGDGGCEVADVEGLAGNLGAADAGELEQGIDQAAHALDAVTDAADVVAAGIVDGLGIVLFEGAAEAVDGAERRAEVVRDGVTEGFELAVGGFELGGAELDLSLIHISEPTRQAEI